jgi:hypothetical protein
MMTRPAEGGPELSFVHGIPQTSSRVAVGRPNSPEKFNYF